MKQQRVSQRCPTLFSPLESRFFFGMTLLESAGRESDPVRRDEMVTRALDTLMDDPDRIEVDRILPLLAKIKKFESIVAICMRKVQQAMQKTDRAEEIQHLFDVIVQVVDALGRGIEEEKPDSIYGDGYLAVFSRAIADMRLDHKMIMRESIVT